MIGDFGYAYKYANVEEAAQNLDIGITTIRFGEDKAKPSPFEPLTEKGKQR